MIRQKITRIINVIDITLLAKLNALLLSSNSTEYNGMKEVVNAPSAKNARNKLAKRNEEKNISAREVAPMTVAINTSLINPKTLEMAVKKLNVKILLNILSLYYLPLIVPVFHVKTTLIWIKLCSYSYGNK